MCDAQRGGTMAVNFLLTSPTTLLGHNLPRTVEPFTPSLKHHNLFGYGPTIERLPNSSIPWTLTSSTVAASSPAAQALGSWWIIHSSNSYGDTATARSTRGVPVAPRKTATPPRSSAFAPSAHTMTWTLKI